MSKDDRVLELEDEVIELEDEIELLKKEVARPKSKYEERCWCSCVIPARCGHKGLL